MRNLFILLCILDFITNGYGQVGINTTIPSHPLHINGNTRIDGRLGMNTPVIGNLGNLLDNGLIEARSSASDSSALILGLWDNTQGYPSIKMSHARGTIEAPIALFNNDTLWAIQGIGYQGSNYTNSGGIRMEVAGINPISATNLPTKLIFSTTPEESTEAIDQVLINPYGNVGINTSMPLEKLHVAGNMVIEEGRIRMINNGHSIFIGDKAGLNDDRSFNNNVYIGQEAATLASDGENNVAIGYKAMYGSNSSYNFALGAHALEGNNIGNDNIGIGNFAGFDLQGQNNIYIGSGTGESTIGTNNIIIGREVGNNKTMDNTLMVDVQNTDTPLIHGNFDTNQLTIHGRLNASEKIGVSNTSPLSALDVNGTVGFKTISNLTVGIDDPDDAASIYIYTNSAGTGTINLPLASDYTNRMYVIINKTGGIVDISSFQNLNNVSQTTIPAASSIWLVSDGIDWQQIK